MGVEASLIREARAGSGEAFSQLVLLYQARIRAFIAQYVRNDRDAVDDLAQEAFFFFYKNLRSYQDDLPLGPWLLRIARNRTIDYLRSEARRRARESSRWQSSLADWRLADLESQGSALEDRHPESQALEECL